MDLFWRQDGIIKLLQLRTLRDEIYLYYHKSISDNYSSPQEKVSVQLHMCNVEKDSETASMEERRHIFDLWTKEWCFLVPGERTVVHCILSLRKITRIVFENKYLRLLFITKSIWQLYRVKGYVMKIVGRNKVIEKSRKKSKENLVKIALTVVKLK